MSSALAGGKNVRSESDPGEIIGKGLALYPRDFVFQSRRLS